MTTTGATRADSAGQEVTAADSVAASSGPRAGQARRRTFTAEYKRDAFLR